MAIPDSPVSSSYSDPIYDRLDTVAEAVRRRWWLYVLALLAVVAIALLIRVKLANRPHEASAAAFNRALDARTDDDRVSQLRALANDANAAAYYRARAGIELAQEQLHKNDATAARVAAEAAVAQAKIDGDTELRLAARLSLAATLFQLDELQPAVDEYDAVENDAGARFAAQELEAIVGGSRALEKQGKTDAAIAKLEPLLTRTDAGAKSLIDLARVRYWVLKRQAAEQAQPAGASATAAAVAPAPTAVEAPAAPAAPVAPAQPEMGPPPPPAAK